MKDGKEYDRPLNLDGHIVGAHEYQLENIYTDIENAIHTGWVQCREIRIVFPTFGRNRLVLSVSVAIRNSDSFYRNARVLTLRDRRVQVLSTQASSPRMSRVGGREARIYISGMYEPRCVHQS